MNTSLKNTFKALSSDGATLAKVIATFCVVLGHSYKLFRFKNVESPETFARTIHAFCTTCLPIFFLIAGYYLVCKGNWDYRSNLKKKIKSLLIPYMGFILIYAVISCVGSLVLPSYFDVFTKFTASDWLMHLFGIPFYKDPIFYGPLWFVRDLFIINVLAFVLVPVVKRLPSYLMIPLMIALFLMPFSRKMCFAISFFVTGMYFGFKKKIPVLNNLILIIILSAVGFVIPIAIEGDLAHDISAAVLSISVLAISEKLVKNEKIKRMAMIAIPFSFPIYLLHEYPMTTIVRLIATRHISMPYSVVIFFVLPIPVILLCIGVAALWKKVLPKTYALFTGGRYKPKTTDDSQIGEIKKSDEKNKTRILYIDIFKALAIIMVVFAHIDYAKPAKAWIASFAMPAFFFSSGMLLKTASGNIKTELVFCRKKLLSLMIPYFLWALIYNAIWSLENRSFDGMRLLYILYGSHQTLGKAHTLTSLWFLPVLFLTMVVFAIYRLLFKKIQKLPVKIIVAAAFLALGWALPTLSKGYPWGVNVVPAAFGFLMLGNAFFPLLEGMRQRLSGKGSLIILMVVSTVFFAGTFIYRFNDPKSGYLNVARADYGNYLLFLPAGIIGTAFLLFFSMMLARVLPKKTGAFRNFFSFFGMTTMCTFATHKLFIRVFEIVFKKVHVPNAVALIVTGIGTIAFCSIAAFIIERYLPILAGRIPERKNKR